MKALSFPARFSNTPKFRIFRRLRLFPNPFYQLQIFYIEAICRVPDSERTSTYFNTRHQSYSSEPSSIFIFPLSTQHKNKYFNYAPDHYNSPRSFLDLFPLHNPILTDYTTANPITFFYNSLQQDPLNSTSQFTYQQIATNRVITSTYSALSNTNLTDPPPYHVFLQHQLFQLLRPSRTNP